MRKITLIAFILILSLSCESKEKNKTIDSDTTELAKIENDTPLASQNEEPIGTNLEDDSNIFEPIEEVIYTFDKLKDEYPEIFLNIEDPIGIYFWDEFEDIETQYGLTEDESKLLGQWLNVNYIRDNNNYYYFFPNKLFLLNFKSQNYQYITGSNLYCEKAVGTWDIVSDIVQFTIYAIIIQNASGNYLPNSNDSKSILIVEQPYTVDFININDIGEEGYTKRTINSTILSNELQQMVIINEPNRINNLYIRTVYSIHWITTSGRPEKNYNFFEMMREIAQENLSGFDIATNNELIEKYIFSLQL